MLPPASEGGQSEIGSIEEGAVCLLLLLLLLLLASQEGALSGAFLPSSSVCSPAVTDTDGILTRRKQRQGVEGWGNGKGRGGAKPALSLDQEEEERRPFRG